MTTKDLGELTTAVVQATALELQREVELWESREVENCWNHWEIMLSCQRI